MSYFLRTFRWSWIGAAAVATLLGCSQPNQYVPPPPPEVTVSLPIQQDVVDSRDYTGTTKAFEAVDIRARVEGFLESVEFREGDDVKRGQLLCRIDPRPFQAALAQARAGVELAKARGQSAVVGRTSAEAELANAEAQLRRAMAADQRVAGAVTQQEIDEKKTAVLVARAAVQSAEAAIGSAQAEVAAGNAEVEKAQLNLNYTQVASPIDGRVGQKNFDVGSLVGRADSSLLTTVVRYDPIYANFTISELDFFQFNREHIAKEGNQPDAAETRPSRERRTIHLGLGDEQGFPHKGYVDYADLAVDESTGTYLVRGRFDNPNRLIPPGAFVRIQVPLEIEQALLVSQEAVGRDQGGAYLLVVNGDNVVETRRVELGGTHEGLQVIRGGELKPDDRVVVKGVQMARPGATVVPVEETTTSTEAASGAVGQ